MLNGIALGKDHVLLTGKRWDRMYKVTFPDWPTLFDSHDVGDQVEGLVENNRIVNEYTVLEQVGHDASSFV